MASKPALTAVPSREAPVTVATMMLGFEQLRYAVAVHMGFTRTLDGREIDPSKVSVAFNHIYAGMIVSFYVQGHDAAAEARMKLSLLPGYTVTRTEQQADGMRKIVRGYVA